MMDIVVAKKEFKNALEAVTLKGKYKSFATSKTGKISDTIACFVQTNKLVLGNASYTIAATCSVNCSNTGDDPDPSLFFFDAEKVMKFTKTMPGDTLTLSVSRSSINFSGGGSRATLPLYIEHKGLEGITKLMVVRLPDEGMASFGNHTYDTQVTVDGKYLATAIKDCSVVGNATYKLDVAKDKLTIESSNDGEEMFTKEVTIMSAGPDEATVEISAPIDKFCEGIMFMYLSDDAPLLLIGPDRKLVIAPYIRGN